MKNSYIILTLTFLLSFGQLYSQANSDIVIGKKHTIHSDILGQDREIFIHLPDGYDDCVSNYPVIYVMDGENAFNFVTGLIDLNSWLWTIPKMIVVGIPNIDRRFDFMPTIDTIPTSGNADKFISFFNEELFPYINDNYRTESFKTLYGFSYLGMFAIHCCMNYPETFNAYIAGSPSLKYNIDKLCDSKQTAQKLNSKSILHISIGELELQSYIDNINRFTSTLENQNNDYLKWKSITVNDATHETNPPFSFNFGINYIFSDWGNISTVIMQGMDSIDNHFDNLSKQYGYLVKVPEDVYSGLGMYYMQNKHTDLSIEVFEKYTQNYESSWTAFDYLGQALVSKNDFKKAEECFQKALELKPDYKNAKDNLENIKGNLGKKN